MRSSISNNFMEIKVAKEHSLTHDARRLVMLIRRCKSLLFSSLSSYVMKHNSVAHCHDMISDFTYTAKKLQPMRGPFVLFYTKYML